VSSCLVLQVVSASVQQRSFDTPNSASMIARSLAERGEFNVVGRRAFQLPAEPLYLAAGFVSVPEQLWPYLHVPIAVVLVAAVTVTALIVAGPSVGLAAGLTASVDPFVLAHGPVWDDAFLAAAFEWTLFAMVIVAASRAPAGAGTRLLVSVACVAGAAAMTRTLGQVVLIGIAAVAISMRRFRAIRPVAIAMLIGVVAALAAWGARNQVVLGTFLVGTTHDGESFFESNCAYTRQGIRELGLVGFQRQCSEPQFLHASRLGEIESNRQFREYGLAYIANNPFEFVKTAAFKLGVSLSGYDFAKAPTSFRNVVAVVTSGAAFVFGVAGLLQLWRRLSPGLVRDTLVLVIVPMAVATLAMLAIGPTGIRYRLTMNGALWIGVATYLVEAIPRRARASGLAGEQIRATS